MYGWDNQAQLENLTTHFCGQACSFCRTCSPHQRSDYTLLKSQLKEWFTPVGIKPIPLGAIKIVDRYDQEFQRLFYLAYPSKEVEKQKVLAGVC